MSNIGFSELLFILILSFIILGPEKLLSTAQTLGLILKKIKQQYSDFQAELYKLNNPIENIDSKKQKPKKNNIS